MNRVKHFWMRLAILAAFGIGAIPATAHALITYSGNIDPSNPNTWTGSTTASIGQTGTGSVSVADGSDLLSGYGYIGYASGSSGEVTVSGEGSTWINSDCLVVGYSGTGTLNITDSASVSNTYSLIGSSSGSTGEVTVSGEGSTWANRGSLYVGRFGTGTLNITDGASVSNTDGYIGDRSGSNGEVTVSDGGSTWTNSSSLHVGDDGDGTLNITGGASVRNTYGYIGYSFGSTGEVTVFGEGSTWTNSRPLVVGDSGTGTLNITDGGTVSSNTYFSSIGSSIGRSSGSTGEVTVSGEGSTWTNSDDLHVGYWGTGTLNITGGASVSSYNSYIGNISGSTGEVTVSGEGSTWTNSDDLYVGYYSTGTLNITDGGLVSVAGFTYVAYYEDATGSINFGTGNFGTGSGTLTTRSLVASSAQLFGTGTINVNGIVSDYDLVFDSTHGLTQTFTIGGSGQDRNITVNLDMSDGDSVGDLGVDNGSLTINGLAVNSRYGYIGYYSGSTGEVTVSGEDATWTNSSNLYVGYYGTGTLNITDGASVRSYYGYIGSHSGSTGEVTVSGEGSTWTNSGSLGYLIVGDSGAGTLNITGGALVRNTHGTIGHDSGSGKVTVSGEGSTWINHGSLTVGSFYGTGTLNITNGASVSNTDGYIGRFSDATGEVTVSGKGSTWTNSNDLCVGYNYGTGTLNITGGGLVRVAGTLTIDEDEDGDSFLNMSTGGMLALYGDADESLDEFLDLIGGTDAIRYYDGDSWESLLEAEEGTDYWLTYYSGGDLAGYTVLTVGTVPEPGTIVLLVTALVGLVGCARRRNRRG